MKPVLALLLALSALAWGCDERDPWLEHRVDFMAARSLGSALSFFERERGVAYVVSSAALARWDDVGDPTRHPLQGDLRWVEARAAEPGQGRAEQLALVELSGSEHDGCSARLWLLSAQERRAIWLHQSASHIAQAPDGEGALLYLSDRERSQSAITGTSDVQWVDLAAGSAEPLSVTSLGAEARFAHVSGPQAFDNRELRLGVIGFPRHVVLIVRLASPPSEPFTESSSDCMLDAGTSGAADYTQYSIGVETTDFSPEQVVLAGRFVVVREADKPEILIVEHAEDDEELFVSQVELPAAPIAMVGYEQDDKHHVALLVPAGGGATSLVDVTLGTSESSSSTLRFEATDLVAQRLSEGHGLIAFARDERADVAIVRTEDGSVEPLPVEARIARIESASKEGAETSRFLLVYSDGGLGVLELGKDAESGSSLVSALRGVDASRAVVAPQHDLIWVPADPRLLYRVELPRSGRPNISELRVRATTESLAVLDDGVAVVHASTTGRVTFVGSAHGARPILHEGFLGLALGEGP